jgi:hypothetical protein
LIKEELTLLREHQNWELGDPTNNGARGGNQKCIKVGAVNRCDLMAGYNEECVHSGKGSLDDIWRWVIVVLLWVGRTRRGGDAKNQQPDGRKTNWWSTPLGMRGTADGAFAGGGRSDDAITMKNHQRGQSTRGKAEGKVDDHHKNNRADNAYLA